MMPAGPVAQGKPHRYRCGTCGQIVSSSGAVKSALIEIATMLLTMAVVCGAVYVAGKIQTRYYG